MEVILTVKLFITGFSEYVNINGKKILCDGRICGKGVARGGGYICPHYNLRTRFPDLVREEWDFRKNEDKPENLSPGSHKKVWWKCKDNHSWQAFIFNRTRKIDPRGCPFCKKSPSRSPSPDDNFAVKCSPELLSEFDKERNPKPPEEYFYRSSIKVWWICRNNPCGCHRWQASFSNRTGVNATGCPFCNSRNGGDRCPHNNFAVKCSPELLSEFDKERNPKSPEEYSVSSHVKIWWVCRINKDHKWQTEIHYRTLLKNPTGCPFCAETRKGYSKKAIEWFKSIEIEQNIKLQYKDPDNAIDEYKIPETRYKADGYHKESNTIYEFHGDFWHGNPNMFDPDDINPVSGKTFGQLYKNTSEKEKKIRELGYNLIVKWETDLEANFFFGL